jgi:LacI family transcriptional regulator
MREGGPKPTIRDVAKSAGVSVGTVSRVLNAHSKVQPGLRERVQKAIADLGYSPNAVAQSMRSRATHTVGCVIREINISALAAFVAAAHDVLDEAASGWVLTTGGGRRARAPGLLERLSRRQMDGIMIGPYSPLTGEFDAFLQGLGVPIVLVDRDEPAWADAVMTDHAQGIRAATEHLLGLGHRAISLITGDPSLYPARERLRGFQEAFRAAGIKPDPSLIHATSFLASAGFRLTSSMLAAKDRPTAIIAGGIGMLPGVLQAIKVRGLRIPADISVIGSGSSELADLHTPPIALQHWDQAEVGRIAANLLLDRILGRTGAEPRHVLVPNALVLRKSVGPARRG